EPRLPAQHPPRPVATGVRADYVPRPWRGLPLAQRRAGHLLERLHHLAYRGARTRAQVEDPVEGAARGLVAAGRVAHDRVAHDLVEPAQAGDVGGGQIPHVDVVADAGPVPGRPVRAGDAELLPGLGRLDQLAQQVGGALDLQAGAQLRV